ncbi:hypothetical protein ACE7GA_07270 [Roseomonas sp. CCTCC AB2023176]|uniref:FitA-like ribbon-helix-helix domain-containing protein n=1 Tax=Roseomonas sp. CCTCC AB2023176 TaxID=3342640 RepID=UPI0035D93D67
MGQLLVRGVEDDLIDSLRRRAAASGRSVEAEHREILRTALAVDVDWAKRRADVIRRAAEMRAATAGRDVTPTEVLQREGREER